MTPNSGEPSALVAAPAAPPSQTLRALTLFQPIGSLVACGAIGVETRTWRTKPGPIAIHSAKSTAGLQWAELPLYKEVLARYNMRARELPLGVVLAVCRIVDVRSTNDWRPGMASEEYQLGDYDRDRWAFVLDRVVALKEPVPAKGGRMIWRLSPEVHEQVVAQL
jgi:hypothetical protein